jgi:hypothetical protein
LFQSVKPNFGNGDVVRARQEIHALVRSLELIGYFIIIMGVILGMKLIYIYYKKESFTEKILMLLPQ